MHGLIIVTIIPGIYKEPFNMYLCNYFNYSPNILRKIKEVDEEVIFAGASGVYIIFTVGARLLILFHPQGLKPWILNSLMFIKEKENIQGNTRDYAILDYLLLLTKKFQVCNLAHAIF